MLFLLQELLDLQQEQCKAAINVFDATFGLGANLCATNVKAYTERQSAVKNKKASNNNKVVVSSPKHRDWRGGYYNGTPRPR